MGRAASSADAVVIRAGHNGLVAAAMLADAGWDVVVLEAQNEPGGAVKSTELTPGYTTDLYSAFYPLAVASPALRTLNLEDYGLRWSHAPAVVGHPRSADDENAAMIYRDLDETAAALDEDEPGDGARWREAFEHWRHIKDPLLTSLFAPFPPVRGALQLLRRLGTGESLRFVHQLLLPAGLMAQSLFKGEAARLLLLGNAMHADVPIDAPGGGIMGYLLIMMAQDGGFPVPVGGAGQLTAALVARATAAGAHIECARPVDSVEVRDGRAVAVRTSDGDRVRVRRAVIADTSAPQLYQRLLPADALPAALLRSFERFVWDTPVLKIDYALNAPIPWRSKNLKKAGTVHLGADHDGLIRWMADLDTATIPKNPFMLFGQMSTADATRSPVGTESAWAYTHLPRSMAGDHAADVLVERVDSVLEAHAPGFHDQIVGKSIQRPSDLQASDANLHTGAVNGGTSQLFQQLIFRPCPDLVAPKPRCRTSISAAPARPPVVGCTACVAAMPPTRRWLRPVGRAGRDGKSTARCSH